MKKIMKYGCCALALCFGILVSGTQVKADGQYYTYTYDYWGDPQESPDAYQPTTFLSGSALGISDFSEPQGLFVKDDMIYVCDTGNNRIVAIKCNNGQYLVDEIIEGFTGELENLTFNHPKDIFVDENGEYYICDTDNERVLHLDKDKNLVKVITQPEDETVDATASFLPTKLVVNNGGRVIVQCQNVNKGFMEFENNGEFSGYMGANEVKFDLADYLWKSIATKEQKEQMEQFVPTEYNNLAVDANGFVYCTTSVFEEWELKNDQAKPIRKLNAMGSDILIKNGYYPPIGDLWWGNAGGVSGASKMIDVTAMDNESYYAIDRTRGRVFGYDEQGNLLYVFGGLGNKLGYFQYPTAIEHMGTTIMVLDSKNMGITVFDLTEYGELINLGLAEYQNGNYEKSAEYWQEVYTLNGNYDLAYIGIGRAELREENYKSAMSYFKVKMDDDYYSKALQLYRKEWIEENIIYIVIALVVIIVLTQGRSMWKKVKREAAQYEDI